MQMKRIIAKNTLSFTCSKSMQFVRTPIDIWESIKTEFNPTLDACASDKNHLLKSIILPKTLAWTRTGLGR